MIQNHLDIVQQTINQLAAQGVNTSGPCGAFEITQRVAWTLRTEGAGLLSKPAGNNCDGYSVDIVAYPGGQIVDILSDAGHTNGALWSEGEPVDPSRWRPPFDPGGSGPIEPDEPDQSLPPYDESKAVEFGLGVNASQAEWTTAHGGQPFPYDSGMIAVMSQRAAHDYYKGLLPWEDSKKRHLNEYRAEYGLPPV